MRIASSVYLQTPHWIHHCGAQHIRYAILNFIIVKKTQVPLWLQIRLGYWRKVISYSVGLKLQGLEKRAHQGSDCAPYILSFYYFIYFELE